jgi:hypothetical protein
VSFMAAARSARRECWSRWNFSLKIWRRQRPRTSWRPRQRRSGRRHYSRSSASGLHESHSPTRPALWRLALPGGHSHSVQGCGDVLARPPRHAPDHGQSFVRGAAVVFSGLGLAEPKLGMLTPLQWIVKTISRAASSMSTVMSDAWRMVTCGVFHAASRYSASPAKSGLAGVTFGAPCRIQSRLALLHASRVGRRSNDYPGRRRRSAAPASEACSRWVSICIRSADSAASIAMGSTA